MEPNRSAWWLFPGLALTLAVSAAPEPAPETLDGQVVTVWIDAKPGAAAPAPAEYWLYRRSARPLRLEVRESQRGAVQRLDRQPVRVRGQSRNGRFELMDVRAAPAGSAAAAEAVPATQPQSGLGRAPWVNLLCQFPDQGTELREPSYFAQMFASTRPGLDYYWKEVSNGAMNVAGTRTFGWYTLPQPYAYYVQDGNVQWQAALDDCTHVADADVHFPDYTGINLVFNHSLGCCAWGGGGFVNRDGIERIYGVTWMPDWGWRNHAVFAHEMGHGMGLPHSRGNNQTYRNLWDVMSDIWHNCHLATDPVLGCLGQHTIAFHKDRLLWVPDAAQVTLGSGRSVTAALDKLERPTAGTYQVLEIPLFGNTQHFYTVEARRKYGFDVRLPGASVVIHEVNLAHGEPANVVDGDGNGDPYDAGTRWLPGETFVDRRHGISVSVGAAEGAGFIVTATSTEAPHFADGFESGDVSAWSGARLDGGDFAVGPAGALEGANGAIVRIDDNNQAHVTDHSPEHLENYMARFRFAPNNVAMASGDRFTIFGGYNDTVGVVTLELRPATGGYEVRALARQDDGTQVATPPAFVFPAQVHELQVEWQAASAAGANDGALRFSVNGLPYADYTTLDNDTLRIERALLGAVTGVDTGTRGTILIDAFRSHRW